ncbi:non-specific serine/threonine protein kinase [Geopseudomonas sagittaria]|uniref:Non-specific serine/threonine protein kinase n=1 Tax=Geopseudomonas sagittaria TaxID=1135990 RepID=A0A1I5TG56_9GAMM|nr:SNF2-related protein [Pseudomonas sagittaria]SFP82052.1 non-specific serine/threonine protein kinase [Pseudomonas sagittaria]
MTLSIHSLRVQDWRQAFRPGDFSRGRDYALDNRAQVEGLDKGLLLAECRGSGRQRYRQRIRLIDRGAHWDVDGRCSCPVSYNCKHVVAALLTVERLQLQGWTLPDSELPPEIVELPVEAPQPRLILGSHVRVHYDARKGRMIEQTQHRAALAFDYQGHLTFGRVAQKEWLVRLDARRQLRIVRQLEAEAALRRQLSELGFSIALRRSEALPESAGEPFELPDDAAWLHFVREQLPQLRERGWQIRLHPDFQFNLATLGQWQVAIEESAEGDWFDLELGIEVDGEKVSLLPILLHAIRHSPWLLTGEALAQRGDDEELLVPLPRSHGVGRRVALPFGRLRPLLSSLGELYFREDDSQGERLRLGKADAARLAELDKLPALHWQGGERLREFARRLQQLPQQPVQPPLGLRAELRDYQVQGLSWMQALRELQVGGILADDMGLGKTLQTLAHILAEKDAGRLTRPALIVMPTSLIPNWQDEAERFAPQLRVLALHGAKRKALFAQIGEHDLVLTTYALLPRDLKQLNGQRWHLLILDEAQNIKNPRSKAASAAGQLAADQRLCLTGTPLENHLGELWSLFNFLMPGWLGESKAFTKTYRTPIEKHADAQRLAHLVARVKPFLLRRTKEQVARELPPKTEITQRIELTDVQRDRYETLRLAMDQKVRGEIQRLGLARSQIVILEALLRLRQACCDLRLLGEDEAAGHASADSGKLSALLEMLEELTSEGRRVLLFSQFTSMLGLIEHELKVRKIAYVKLTGATQDRRAPVQAFQAGRVPVFLISLKAGGAGLNLTAADTVIHFDPWWNPAAEAQASDRAYRIGQDKPVFVYKLIARGSVEEKIQQLQQSKASLARSVLEGGGQGDWTLSEADLDALFAPLN